MLSERASWRLQAAVSSVREARGEDEFGLPGGDLRLLTQHGLLQSEDEAEELLTTIITVCKQNIPIKTLSTSGASGVRSHGRVEEASGLPITASDMLHVALLLPYIARDAILTFVEFLNEGVVADREAVRCLSRMRLYIQERTNRVTSSMGGDDELLSNLDAKSLTNELSDIASVCMACIRPNQLEKEGRDHHNYIYEDDREIAPNNSCHASAVALELLPYIVDQLRTLSNGSASDVIDSLFRTSWPPHMLLSICNLVCDLIPFFQAQRLVVFRRKLLYCLPSIGLDDFPGVIRVCFYIFEICDCAVEWLHVVRVLYRTMQTIEVSSESSRLNNEAVLEQTCALLPLHISTKIIELLENFALAQLQTFVDGNVNDWSDMGTYEECNGVPILSPCDILLVLLLFRSVGGSSSVGRSNGTRSILVQPPSLDTDKNLNASSNCGRFGAMEGDYYFYACGRSCFVLLICCAVKSVAVEAIEKNYFESVDVKELLAEMATDTLGDSSGNKQKKKTLAVEVEDIMKVCVTSIRGGIHSCGNNGSSGNSSSVDNSSWIISARAQDLIAFFLHMITLPDLTNQCLDVMVSMSTSKRSLSKEDFRDVVEVVVTIGIESIFTCVQDSEATILSSMLSNIVAFSSASSQGQILKRKSRSGNRESSASEYNPIASSLNSTSRIFKRLIEHHRHKAVRHTKLLHSYVMTLTLLPLADLRRGLTPLITLSRDCRLLFGSLLTFYRKTLLNKEDDKRIFAITSLIELMGAVNESSQIEIMQILVHALVLPLKFRRVFYSTLWAHFQTSCHNGNNSWREKIKARVLFSLLDKLKRHANVLLFDNEDWSDVEFSPRESVDYDSMNYMLHNCFEVDRTDLKISVVTKEDLPLLLSLIASIEIYCSLHRPCHSGRNKTKGVDPEYSCLHLVVSQFCVKRDASASKGFPLNSMQMDLFPVSTKYLMQIMNIITCKYLLHSPHDVQEKIDDDQTTATRDKAPALIPDGMIPTTLGQLHLRFSLVQSAVQILRVNYSQVAGCLDDAVTAKCEGNIEPWPSFAKFTVICFLISGYCEALIVLFNISKMLFDIAQTLSSDKVTYNTFCEELTYVGNVHHTPCSDTVIILSHILNELKTRVPSLDVPISYYFGAVSVCCCEIEKAICCVISRDDNERIDSRRISISSAIFSVYEYLCSINRESEICDVTCGALKRIATLNEFFKSSGQDILENMKSKKKKVRNRGRRIQQLIFSELSDDDGGNTLEDDDNTNLRECEVEKKEMEVVQTADMTDAFVDLFDKNSALFNFRILHTILSGVPDTLLGNINRPDLVILSGQHYLLQPDMGSVMQFEKSFNGYIRHALFSLRSYVLDCIRATLCTESFPQQCSGPYNSNGALEYFFCEELLRAVQRGVSVRNFKAFIETIKKVHDAISFTRMQPRGADDDVSTNSIGLVLLQTLTHLRDTSSPQLVRVVLNLYLHISSSRGCLLLLKALSQAIFINDRCKSLQESDVAHLQSEKEVAIMLSFFLKNAKTINTAALDVVNQMHHCYLKCTEEYERLGNKAGDNDTSSFLLMSLSELIWYPLLCPIEPNLVAFVHGATQVKNSDSLLGLTNEGFKNQRMAAARSKAPRKSVEAPPSAAVIILKLYDEKFKRKYYSLLSKYLNFCSKQCIDIFKSFRDESNYISGIHELCGQHNAVNGERARSLRRKVERNAFTERDGNYSDLEDCDDYTSDEGRVDTEETPTGSVDDDGRLKNSCERIIFSGSCGPQCLVDALSPAGELLQLPEGNIAVNSKESPLVFILRNRDLFGALLPQGNAVLNRTEELVIRLKHQNHYFTSLSSKKRTDVLKNLNPDEVLFFKHIARYVETLRKGISKAGSYVTSVTKDSAEDGIEALSSANSIDVKSIRRGKKRLRSRNKVIDEWLEGEDGTDTYVDLEDFLVF